MNWLSIFGLFIIFSSCLGDNFLESLSFAKKENFKQGVNSYSFTPNYIGPDDADNDYQEEDEPDISFSNNIPEERNDSVSVNNITFKKHPLDHLFKLQNFDFEGEYRDEDSKLSQNLMRRQTGTWEAPDEFFDLHRSQDGSHQKPDFSQIQNEYIDDNYSFDASQRNETFLEESEGSFPVEPPQYYQKNYYYNYYPLVRGRYDQNKFSAQKVGSGEELLYSEAASTNEKLPEKKSRKKNPCKMYLQFLKYAFKELDKNSDYDDLDEEYIDWEADGNQRVFATQLLGPTLFIDNSGRVFQVNTNGNSIQTVEKISPSSKVVSPERDFFKPRLTTQISSNEYKTETSLSQPLYDSYIITYDHPSGEVNANTESQKINDKGSHQMVSEEKFRSEHTYLTMVPTDAEKVTTYTEPTLSFTTLTTLSPKFLFGEHEDYYRRSGLDLARPALSTNPNKNYSAAGSPLYLHRYPGLTLPSASSDKSHLRTETIISFENSHNQGGKDPADCNDKTLPCPDTFNITYPLNGYCNRYVSCESGVAIRRTCPNGFHFNVITKSCDFPHNSICSYYCPEPNGKFGIPGDCSGYFICENSIPEYRMCPPRMHWDAKISSCTFAALSSCPMKCTRLNEIKPYKGDCKAYIICLNGIPYYHKCPPNFVYNNENQMCVPQNQFNCRNDPKLMTKTSNPNTLCKNVDQKLGTKAWCSYYFPPENSGSEEKFSRA